MPFLFTVPHCKSVARLARSLLESGNQALRRVNPTKIDNQICPEWKSQFRIVQNLFTCLSQIMSIHGRFFTIPPCVHEHACTAQYRMVSFVEVDKPCDLLPRSIKTDSDRCPSTTILLSQWTPTHLNHLTFSL